MSNVKYTTVHSTILNRTFYFEVIEDHPDNLDRVEFGDINPATKKLEGSYGKKNKGGINMADSVITKENGFNDIKFLPPGTSPHGYIELLEKEYLRKQLENVI